MLNFSVDNKISNDSQTNLNNSTNLSINPINVDKSTGLSNFSKVPASNKGENGKKVKDALEEKKECHTCSERRYQDGSNDPGVSFKAPTKMSPDSAASAVVSHEMEHVYRNKAKAESEGREIVSQNVSIFTAVCPECGRGYVSGGETTTVTKTATKKNKENEQVNKMDFSI